MPPIPALSAAPTAPAAVQEKVTAADLAELADYTEFADGVTFTINYAPNAHLRGTAPTREQAESAVHDFCAHLARHLNSPR